MEDVMRVLRSMGVWAACGLMMAFANTGWSQQNNGGGPLGGTQNGRGSAPTVSPPSISPIVPPDMAPSPPMEQDQARMRNADRQKQLVTDTEKLLALATELKTDVDKSNKDMLSLDVIRKADEIEKLAHMVKEKMKGT
jgi:hypothetical protein